MSLSLLDTMYLYRWKHNDNDDDTCDAKVTVEGHQEFQTLTLAKSWQLLGNRKQT